MTQNQPLNDLHAPICDTLRPPDALAPEQADATPEPKEAAPPKYEPIPNHPLARLKGAFNDEPLWDEFWQRVLEYREKQNEIEDD